MQVLYYEDQRALFEFACDESTCTFDCATDGASPLACDELFNVTHI